ncbi:LAMI_0G16666g1_1 [Lachancea mirantina]|uniref:LAMI_0G16666g1_1 n=1 Tax=Lachancea mirantina TaxID=1230905 RepID=A0A1G4KCN4_9SACH|nr:LAMI_0G16666g1_1 [Lachancea mirantina]
MSLAIEVQGLTYKFPNAPAPALVDVSLEVGWNTRTLIVGSNGAGKSTLLKLLSGKHLCLTGNILVDGMDPFSPVSQQHREQDGCQTTTYLGTEWCHMSFINRDIGVLELLNSIGFEHFRDRGEALIDILDVDVNWRMHRLSDGQKRRVQLAMGLLKPWRLLLLDEVTVDLDVLARSRLLSFLEHETRNRRCSVVYATHIFDGLAEWPDKLIHIRDGRLVKSLDYKQDVFFEQELRKVTESGKTVKLGYTKSLHPLALSWISKDEGKN